MPNRTIILESLVGTPVTIFFQDMAGVFQWFVNPQSIWAQSDHVGACERDIVDDADLVRLVRTRRQAAETGEPRTVEIVAREVAANGRVRKWNLRLTYNRTVDQQSGIEGFICSCIDITEQVQREQTLKNLLREIAHRSKNMLAMVSSLSAQTARVATSKDEFVRRFTGRLQSLSKSQDIITDRDWRGSTLTDLIGRQVQDVVPVVDGQITFAGDDLELGPNGTMHVGLALHELVTNAVLHGALTMPDGKIVISCKQGPSEEGAVLTWTETPRAVHAASRPQSFGQIMLERIVPSAVNGAGRLDLSDEAVTYTLTIGALEIV
ncbi:sensor histidine kinase [Oricola thermophila]|uniref:histidine kinase n=1 Tax=Oricola thermophila TaxID=2742145 RepID=A0A6N1VDP9_9HYPH|nr:PAS domain-containing sensor histidine kinase [Oricola thermophila]QKV19026.1 PAS domain-containing protein [Oricola thermophila]